MGVSAEHLGQPVRCPTCQQVVLTQAPAEAPAEPPLPLPGAEPLPPDAPAEPPPSEPPAPEAPLPPTSFTDAPPPDANGEPAPWPLADTAARRREPARGSWLLPLVLLPLVIWAVGATVAAVWGWSEVVKANRRPSLFDQFPDVEGDNPGVRKGKPAARLEWSPLTAAAELPAHLRVPLGGVLALGDLEVRPVRVARGKVKVHTPGEAKPRELPHEALVLTLRLKNVAADYSFAPLDNYFDRRWEGDGPPPLTVLQAGKALFWGGSHQWGPRGRGGAGREWPAGPGRNDGGYDGLEPGAEGEAVVTTNGDDAEVARVLFGVEPGGRPAEKGPYRGPLLWRVHLRRGLVPWRGQPRPACAVVGVEFTDADYLGKEE